MVVSIGVMSSSQPNTTSRRSSPARTSSSVASRRHHSKKGSPAVEVYIRPLLPTFAWPELAGYRSSPPSRLWPSVTPCSKCFRHLRLIFLSVSSGCVKVYLRCCIFCNDNVHVTVVCFKYFRHMFQVFHLDVAKVDLGVAHVAIVIHACFKCFKSTTSVAHVLTANSLTSAMALPWSPSVPTANLLERRSWGRWQRGCGKQRECGRLNKRCGGGLGHLDGRRGRGTGSCKRMWNEQQAPASRHRRSSRHPGANHTFFPFLSIFLA
jgi:hypothetical protein